MNSDTLIKVYCDNHCSEEILCYECIKDFWIQIKLKQKHGICVKNDILEYLNKCKKLYMIPNKFQNPELIDYAQKSGFDMGGDMYASRSAMKSTIGTIGSLHQIKAAVKPKNKRN